MTRPFIIGSFALLIIGSLAPRASYADVFIGKLADEKGSAVAVARVVYQCNDRQAKNRAGALLKFAAVTAGDGTFAFNGFPTQASRQLPVTFGVQLPNGHLSTATFRARGATATVRDRRALALFKVVDEHGKGIGGAEIVLRGVAILSPDGSGFFMQQGAFAQPQRFKAGPDGALRVSNLPARIDVFFECVSVGCPEKDGDFVTAADRPSKVDVTLRQGVTLRGRVNHLGKPAPGATVHATSYTLDNNVLREESFGANTDARGVYTLVVAAGSIKITAKAKEAGSLFGRPLSGVHAAAGTELDGLDISLVDAIKVTGRVVEEGTEKPIKDARVDGDFGQVRQTKMTGPDGTFTMTAPPGPAQFRIQHIGQLELGYGYPELHATLDADHNPPLKFFIAHTALIPPIRGLEGVVYNAKGQPVAGARVGIVFATMSANTDARGRFKFDAPIKPGSQLYAVGGRAATSRNIVLLDPHPLNVTLDAPLAECSGSVVDDIGRPVAGAEITLSSTRDDNFNFPIDHATSDAEGRFHFTGVYAGMPDYSVDVNKPGFGGTSRGDLKVKPGQRLEVKDLTIARADASITGTVLDPDGGPAAGVAVTCGGAKAITDEHGVFHLMNVPRGDVWISLVGLDGGSGSASARSGQTDVVIHMEKPAQTPSTTYQDMRGQTAGALVPGEWLNASPIDLASLKGKIVVIDLWAVWCAPCVHALPEVEALYKKYRANGVEVIGIHVTGTPLDQEKQFVKQKGLTYPVFMDTPQGTNAALFPAKGIPQLYVVSGAGKIVCDTHRVIEAIEAVDAELKKR